MRLTIVAHDVGGVGGMERVLSELAGGLLRGGHQVTIISRTCNLPAHRSLRWVRVPGPARPFPVAYPWFFLLGSLLTWRRRDGVLLTTGAIVANRSDWSAVHLCHHAIRALGVSRTSRRTMAYRLNAGLAAGLSRLGERVCYRPGRTRRLIAVSGGVATELAHHFPQTSVVTIQNGVSLNRFRPNTSHRGKVRARYGVGESELVAVFVGNEWQGKGLGLAIEALVHAKAWKLFVVGTGDEDRYQARADALGVGARVLFAGCVEDPAPFYCAADCFVLPSIYETFSLVTYEAAAAGIPLLVTRVSGVTDLLVEGENGWFISSDAADIGGKLQALGEDVELRTRMGSAARTAATSFSWQRMIGAYRRLLDDEASTGALAGTHANTHHKSREPALRP